MILIVEYPTPQAFIDMVTTQEYAKVHEHRAGLDRGDLIATSTWSVMAETDRQRTNSSQICAEMSASTSAAV